MTTTTAPKRLKDLQPEWTPAAEETPWLMHCAPGVVLCKDGSLMAAFTYTGVDIDNIDEYRLESTLRDLESAYGMLDERFFLWWQIDKRKDRAYQLSDFPETAGTFIDRRVAEQIESGTFYSFSYTLFLLYTGETGVFKYMDNVQRLVNEEGMNWLKAMVKSATPTEMTRQGSIHDARQLDQNIAVMEEGIGRFIGRMINMSFRRLTNWELDTSLVKAANIGLDARSQFSAPPGALLDTWGSVSEVHVGREVVVVDGPNRSVYLAQLALQEYPKNLAPAVFEKLFATPGELRLTHVIRCLNQPQAKSLLTESAEYYKFAQSSLAARVISYFSSNPPAVDSGKHELYLQCVEALRRQTSENLGWVRHTATITVFAESIAAVESAVRDVTRTMNDFALIRERLNLGSSYFAIFPGAWQHQQRLGLINTERVADCSPIFTADPGSDICSFLSKEVYQRPVPVLSVFRNVYGGRVHFDPLATGLGHALLVMPSGGGKTTFANFCLSQFGRYEGARRLIFDRDASCRITTALHGGRNIDLKSNQVKLAPLNAARHGEGGRRWARQWLINVLEEGGYPVTAQDRNQIDKRLKEYADSDQRLTISNFCVGLAPELVENLAEWTKSGPFGMFDHDIDDLDFGHWTCIDMKEIMKVERLARAFLDHCLYMLDRQLDGTPTFIYVEEASFMLSNPLFAPILADWLKTFRKKNAIVWLTVQSPESLACLKDETLRATMVDNIPNILLGFNPKLEQHREVYKDLLGMSEDHIDLIKQIKPKRDYIWSLNGVCRTMTTAFTPDMLAYLRSDSSIQKLFDEHANSGRAEWQTNYLTEATRRSA